jgi:hypothetical protein
MRVRSLSLSSVLALAFAAALFSAGIPAHADTYQIVGSWFEDTWGFDGIDPSGHVYLQNFFAVSDFQTEILSPTGGSIIINSSLPLTFVSDRGSSCLESAPGFSSRPEWPLQWDPLFVSLCPRRRPRHKPLYVSRHRRCATRLGGT